MELSSPSLAPTLLHGSCYRVLASAVPSFWKQSPQPHPPWKSFHSPPVRGKEGEDIPAHPHLAELSVALQSSPDSVKTDARGRQPFIQASGTASGAFPGALVQPWSSCLCVPATQMLGSDQEVRILSRSSPQIPSGHW